MLIWLVEIVVNVVWYLYYSIRGLVRLLDFGFDYYIILFEGMNEEIYECNVKSVVLKYVFQGKVGIC